jgi:hypothetical protein
MITVFSFAVPMQCLHCMVILSYFSAGWPISCTIFYKMCQFLKNG